MGVLHLLVDTDVIWNFSCEYAPSKIKRILELDMYLSKKFPNYISDGRKQVEDKFVEFSIYLKHMEWYVLVQYKYINVKSDEYTNIGTAETHYNTSIKFEICILYGTYYIQDKETFPSIVWRVQKNISACSIYWKIPNELRSKARINSSTIWTYLWHENFVSRMIAKDCLSVDESMQTDVLRDNIYFLFSQCKRNRHRNEKGTSWNGRSNRLFQSHGSLSQNKVPRESYEIYYQIITRGRVILMLLVS